MYLDALKNEASAMAISPKSRTEICRIAPWVGQSTTAVLIETYVSPGLKVPLLEIDG
jgi:hypothetical protein